MKKGGERKAMENWDESSFMEDDDLSWLMEADDEETLRKPPSLLVMCSICTGFVVRKKPTAKEVVEVVTEAEQMRALTEAVLLHGPLQEIEPAQATERQRRFLGQMRKSMMETKRCPACSRSVLEIFMEISALWLSKNPRPDDEEDKAGGSKEKKKKKISREEGSELMAVLPSQGGKERKKIATEDEAMVADARSVKKSKQSREYCNKKKKARSSSGSKKKAKVSSEMEGSGMEEAEMEGNRSKDVKMKVRESASGNGKTKMVTRRLDKMSIDFILEECCPPFKPHTYDTNDPFILNPFLECMSAGEIAQYNVDLEFRDYLRRQASIRGYAEFQLEVTDDEEE